MRQLSRYAPTLLIVLVLALGTTGVVALGAHDATPPEEADFGQNVAEQATEDGDVSETAQDNHGAAVADFVETTGTTIDEGCERGLAIADFASGEDHGPAEVANGNCENAGGAGVTTQGDGQGVSGEDTAADAQQLGEQGEANEGFGRDTASHTSGGQSDAGDAGGR